MTSEVLKVYMHKATVEKKHMFSYLLTFVSITSPNHWFGDNDIWFYSWISLYQTHEDHLDT